MDRSRKALRWVLVRLTSEPNTNMTVEHLLESVREQWQKLGFHPNVTVTFSTHVKEVTATVPSAALPTIFIPVPQSCDADPTNEP